MSTAEVVSAVASVVSAVGGAFAAVAAFRSAASAQKAQLSADEAERRVLLREVAVTAKEAELEARRCTNAAALAARARQDLAIFTNNLGGDRHRLSQQAFAEKSERADAIGREAKTFSDSAHVLRDSPPSELDRVLANMLKLLTEAKGLREDLERERDGLERECEPFRAAAIQGRAK